MPDAYDVLIRVPGYKGQWDEEAQGFRIPLHHDTVAAAMAAADRLFGLAEFIVTPARGGGDG